MPDRGHRRRRRGRSRRSRFVMTTLVTAVVICAAAILTQWWLPTAGSAKQTVAVKNSQPAQIYEVPPKPPPTPTPKPKPKPKPKPTPTPKPTHTQAAARMPDGPPPGDWTLKFDDEFNGTSLDTAKWSTGWGGGSGITPPVNSSEDDCYDPAQVAEGGGALSLALIRKSESCGISAQYAAGLISTDGKFNFTYGFIQARVWLPGAPGNPDYVANWPGVWTDGQNWPEDGEIDIAEGINGHVCAFFHNGATVNQALSPGGGNGCPSGIYTGGWHTFAANWEPGIITWYYDGVDIGSVTSGVTSAPMFLILDYDAQPPVHAPDTMEVDYIRVWQHP